MRKLKILLVTNDPHLPQRYCGAFVSTHELATGLEARGHKVALLASLAPGGSVHLLNRLKHLILRQDFPKDYVMGYPVYRGWGGATSKITHALPKILSSFAPDIVIAQGGQAMGLAVRANELDIPSIVYLRDVEFQELDADPLRVPSVKYIANSEFTSSRFYARYGIASTVIPPMVHMEKYRVKSSHDVVIFVNPHPKKGLHIAVALAAARPDINFVFQESWVLSVENRLLLDKSIQRLPNVKLCAPVADMRSAYANARIVLAPSQWEEAWGRIATEAQVSGIPVLGSNRGGLPEAIGSGGIVVPIEAPIDDWLKALSSLWDDAASYSRYSLQALAHSNRPEIQPDFLLGKLESMLVDSVKSLT